MKKDKISAQDVIDHLSADEKRTKKLSEDFYKSFIASIEEALQNREQVKVKDLGTFKLNWIAPRKSVNVQTGEQIVIEGYYKVIFTPDGSLKKKVNKPFEHLETIVLDEQDAPENKMEEKINPMAALEEQANEIKDILNEINEISPSKEDITEQPEEVVAEEIIIVEEVKPQPKEEQMQPKPEKPKETKSNSPVEPLPSPALPPKKKRTWIWVVISILVLVILGFALFCLFSKKDAKPQIQNKTEVATPVVAEQEEVISVVEPEPVVQELGKDEWQEAFDSRLNNVEYITTIKLSSGERLSLFAS